MGKEAQKTPEQTFAIRKMQEANPILMDFYDPLLRQNKLSPIDQLLPGEINGTNTDGFLCSVNRLELDARFVHADPRENGHPNPISKLCKEFNDHLKCHHM